MLKITATQLKETLTKELGDSVTNAQMNKIVEQCEDDTIENENTWTGRRE